MRGQLGALQGINTFLSTAPASALPQIRAELAVSVAASHSLVQQAESVAEISEAAETSRRAAEYAAATAELDRQIAGTFTIDRDNNALAHVIAKRFGVDLSSYDHEREALEEQRRRAIADGDKVAEREADLLIAENTYNALSAAGEKITDPGERAALDKAKQQQKEAIERLKKAHETQERLRAERDGETAATPAADSAQLTQAPASKFVTAKASSDFSLSAAPAIALSQAPNAHSEVQVPQLAVAAPAAVQTRT